MIFDDDTTDITGQVKEEKEKQRHIGGVELVIGEKDIRSITKSTICGDAGTHYTMSNHALSVLRGESSPSHHQQSLQVAKDFTHKETSLDEGSEQEGDWGGGEGRGPEDETENVGWERGGGKIKGEIASCHTTTNSAILPTGDSGTAENYFHADTPTTATTAKEGRTKSGRKRRLARDIFEKRWDEQRTTYHRPVPVTLVFSVFTVCMLLCLFIFVRLATWGEVRLVKFITRCSPYIIRTLHVGLIPVDSEYAIRVVPSSLCFCQRYVLIQHIPYLPVSRCTRITKFRLQRRS
jgi:hypothetical protein